MKLKTLLISLTIIVIIQTGNAQVFEWAKSMAGTGSDQSYSVTIDDSGNVYTTGYFSGTVDFDPGTETFNLISNGGIDVFISKTDAAGNFLWAKNMGGTGNDFANSIAVDPTGNVYSIGSFAGIADFDPSEDTFDLTSGGGTDVYISKLDETGNFLWAKNIDGPNSDRGHSIALDASDNVYITGYFESTADFDPGPETFNLSSVNDDDIFISKLDTDGNFLWAKSMGGTSSDQGFSITLDDSGNVYTTGYFYGTVDFDPSAEIFNLTAVGSADPFVSKLDADGNFLWAKDIGGGTNSVISYAIVVDDSGNIYTTGYFNETVDFDSGPEIYNLTATGISDFFISKLDAAGDLLWAKNMGGVIGDVCVGYGLALDSFGNIYTTGTFQGTTDFDPDAGTFQLTSAGLNDIFVTKFDPEGDLLWAKGMGGTGDDFGRSIEIDASDNVYTTGYFWSTADFDPGEDNFDLTSAGSFEIFIQKMSPCINTSSTDEVVACNSYTWIDGNTYTTSSNTPTHTIPNAIGCDSVITLNLVINSVSDITTSINGTTIQANNTDATYQWLDCNNDFAIIPGETSQSFTAITDGSYAVELTEGDCVDISDCVVISTIGIIENEFDSEINVFPSPVDRDFSIDMGKNYNTISVDIADLNGNIVQSQSFSNTQLMNLRLEAPTGVYLLIIKSMENRAVYRLVKN